jgi:hypothetical protein
MAEKDPRDNRRSRKGRKAEIQYSQCINISFENIIAYQILWIFLPTMCIHPLKTIRGLTEILLAVKKIKTLASCGTSNFIL